MVPTSLVEQETIGAAGQKASGFSDAAGSKYKPGSILTSWKSASPSEKKKPRKSPPKKTADRKPRGEASTSPAHEASKAPIAPAVEANPPTERKQPLEVMGLPIDVDTAVTMTAQLQGKVKYGWGSKVDVNTKIEDLTDGDDTIDCSGFVRYMVHKSSTGLVDTGRWGWSGGIRDDLGRRSDEMEGAGRESYDQALKSDGNLHISGFDEGGKKRHVWATYGGKTLESHGGVGVDRLDASVYAKRAQWSYAVAKSGAWRQGASSNADPARQAAEDAEAESPEAQEEEKTPTAVPEAERHQVWTESLSALSSVLKTVAEIARTVGSTLGAIDFARPVAEGLGRALGDFQEAAKEAKTGSAPPAEIEASAAKDPPRVDSKQEEQEQEEREEQEAEESKRAQDDEIKPEPGTDPKPAIKKAKVRPIAKQSQLPPDALARHALFMLGLLTKTLKTLGDNPIIGMFRPDEPSGLGRLLAKVRAHSSPMARIAARAIEEARRRYAEEAIELARRGLGMGRKGKGGRSPVYGGGGGARPADGSLTGVFYPGRPWHSPAGSDAKKRAMIGARRAILFVHGAPMSYEDHCREAQKLANKRGTPVVGIFNSSGGALTGPNTESAMAGMVVTAIEGAIKMATNPSVLALADIFTRSGDPKAPNGGLLVEIQSNGAAIIMTALRMMTGKGKSDPKDAGPVGIVGSVFGMVGKGITGLSGVLAEHLGAGKGHGSMFGGMLSQIGKGSIGMLQLMAGFPQLAGLGGIAAHVIKTARGGLGAMADMLPWFQTSGLKSLGELMKHTQGGAFGSMGSMGQMMLEMQKLMAQQQGRGMFGSMGQTMLQMQILMAQQRQKGMFGSMGQMMLQLMMMQQQGMSPMGQMARTMMGAVRPSILGGIGHIGSNILGTVGHLPIVGGMIQSMTPRRGPLGGLAEGMVNAAALGNILRRRRFGTGGGLAGGILSGLGFGGYRGGMVGGLVAGMGGLAGEMVKGSGVPQSARRRRRSPVGRSGGLFAGITAAMEPNFPAMMGPIVRMGIRGVQQVGGAIGGLFGLDNLLQLSGPATGAIPQTDPGVQARINALRPKGAPLPQNVRQQLEPTMGMDLSGVRIHTDPQASELSRDIGARAFTTGSDIFFASGQYDPGSASGQQLLAHELTHVVQQASGRVAPVAKMVQREDGLATARGPMESLELEARRAGEMVLTREEQAALAVSEMVLELEPEEMATPLDHERLNRLYSIAVERAATRLSHQGIQLLDELDEMTVSISLDLRNDDDQLVSVWAAAIASEALRHPKPVALAPSIAQVLQRDPVATPQKIHLPPETKEQIQQDVDKVASELQSWSVNDWLVVAVLAKWKDKDAELSNPSMPGTPHLDFLLTRLQIKTYDKGIIQTDWVNALDELYRRYDGSAISATTFRSIVGSSPKFQRYRPEKENLSVLKETGKEVFMGALGILKQFGLALTGLADTAAWAIWTDFRLKRAALKSTLSSIEWMTGTKIPGKNVLDSVAPPASISEYVKSMFDETAKIAMNWLEIDPKERANWGLNSYEFGDVWGKVPATLFGVAAGNQLGAGGKLLAVAASGQAAEGLYDKVDKLRNPKDGTKPLTWGEIVSKPDIWTDVASLIVGAIGAAGGMQKNKAVEETFKKIGYIATGGQIMVLLAAYRAVDSDPSIKPEDKTRRKHEILADIMANGLQAVDTKYGEAFEKRWKGELHGTPPAEASSNEAKTSEAEAQNRAKEEARSAEADAKVEEKIAVEEPQAKKSEEPQARKEEETQSKQPEEPQSKTDEPDAKVGEEPQSGLKPAEPNEPVVAPKTPDEVTVKPTPEEGTKNRSLGNTRNKKARQRKAAEKLRQAGEKTGEAAPEAKAQSEAAPAAKTGAKKKGGGKAKKAKPVPTGEIKGEGYLNPDGTLTPIAPGAPKLGQPGVPYVHQVKIGDAILRAGAENQFYSGSEPRTSNGESVDLSKMDRGHSVGPGFGIESPNAIRYVPSKENRAGMAGIEHEIRRIYENRPPGSDVEVTVSTQTYVGTLRLAEVSYKVEIVRDGVRTVEYTAGLKVSNDAKNATVTKWEQRAGEAKANED